MQFHHAVRSVATVVGLFIHLKFLSMFGGSGVKRSVLKVSLYETAVNHFLVHKAAPGTHYCLL